MSQPSSISIGAGPQPIFTPPHQPCPPLCITQRCSPQYFKSGLWLNITSPNGVCPESLGRLSIKYLPLTLRGKRTPFLLKGRNGFSRRVNDLKSFVRAKPIAAPSKSVHQIT